jgi:AraC-like DNA-binding protein
MREKLQAYSLFYSILQDFLPNMMQSELFPDPNLQKAIIFIMENWDREFSMTQVAQECSISESKLYHMFQKQLGQTPVNFLNSVKINYAISYLEKDMYTISEISRLVNFKSENHFRKVFSQITGTTPLKYRKQTQ